MPMLQLLNNNIKGTYLIILIYRQLLTMYYSQDTYIIINIVNRLLCRACDIILFETLYCWYFLCAVADLTFNQSAYIIEESNGVVQFTLLLSIPLAFDINVQVLSINGLASGECVLVNRHPLLKFFMAQLLIILLDHTIS